MDKNQLARHLNRITRATVGVLGDCCLDAYWSMDAGCQERSVETGKPVNRVLAQAYSLGGAGNVVANLAALGVGGIRAFGVLGDDLFGRELRRQLEALEADCAGMALQRESWDTTVYAKPHDGDAERSRFDFGTTNQILGSTEKILIAKLDEGIGALDALIVNQQLPSGYHSPRVIDEINRIAAAHPQLPILVDARHKNRQFTNVLLKLNAAEAQAYCNADNGDLESHAAAIANTTGKPVIITQGGAGMLLFDGAACTHVPAIQVPGPTDPVGAGDTAIAAFAALLGAGASLVEAACIASLATSVTVQKLKTTGTATPEEILRAGSTA